MTDPDLTGIDIDTSRPVLVTGATGYVAGWIVKGLLDAGATVHAAVRDPGNAAKVAHLVEAAEPAPGAPGAPRAPGAHRRVSTANRHSRVKPHGDSSAWRDWRCWRDG